MNSFTFHDEPHGYYDGEPYKIVEFGSYKKFLNDTECNIFEIQNLKGATFLDKWVWLVINSSSNLNSADGFYMFLLHVIPEQLAELLDAPLNDIVISINHLIQLGRLKRYEIVGKTNIYAAI